MKPNYLQTTTENGSFATFCRNYCRKLVVELQRIRQDLIAQFRKTFVGNERMLRLALNEAQALAFLTEYPLLVFPSLALEKVESVMAWQRHQQRVVEQTYDVFAQRA